MRSHQERRWSAAWTLKVLALAPIVVSAALFVYTGGLGGTIVALIVGAFGYLGWRRPHIVGPLFLVWAPVGAFLVLVGSTNLDPVSQVIFGFIWFAGLPLLSGLLFLAASTVAWSQSRRNSKPPV